MLGDLWMKAFLEIHMEGVHSIMIHMIEICMHHHPLPVECGLSLEGIMMRTMQLQETIEGAKGLEAENGRSFMVSLKTGTAVLTKAGRTAMREIMNMVVMVMIRIMKEAREIVAGEDVIHVTANVKGVD